VEIFNRAVREANSYSKFPRAIQTSSPKTYLITNHLRNVFNRSIETIYTLTSMRIGKWPETLFMGYPFSIRKSAMVNKIAL
jgi:hypothetical protein